MKVVLIVEVVRRSGLRMVVIGVREVEVGRMMGSMVE